MAFEAQAKQQEALEELPTTVEPSGRQVMAALLGLTPEELEQHPERAEAALPELLNGLEQALKAVFSGDQAEVDAARQNVEALQERLEAQGISTQAAGAVREEAEATAEGDGGEPEEDVGWWRAADARLLQATEAWKASNQEHLTNIAEELKAVLTAEMQKEQMAASTKAEPGTKETATGETET